jgi:hypothetical protein
MPTCEYKRRQCKHSDQSRKETLNAIKTHAISTRRMVCTSA